MFCFASLSVVLVSLTAFLACLGVLTKEKGFPLGEVEDIMKVPAPPKGGLMVLFMYSKASKRHPLGGAGYLF